MAARRDDDPTPPHGRPLVAPALHDEWSVWDADVHLYTEEFPDVTAALDAAATERATYAELGISRNLEIHLRRRHVSAWTPLGLDVLEPPQSLLVDEHALHTSGQPLAREYRILGLLDGARRTLSVVDSLGDAAECALMWRHAHVHAEELEARWTTPWRRVDR